MTTALSFEDEVAAIAAALADLADEVDTAGAVERGHAPIADLDTTMLRFTTDDLLAGACLRRGDNSQRTYAKAKEIHRHPNVIAAEQAARVRTADTRRKRIRRQQQRRTRIEKERTAKPLDPLRMSACLALLGNLTHVIADLTLQRYNRFRRTLGDVNMDDIAQDAILAIAEAMARTDTDIVAYAEMVLWLKDAPQPYVAADGPAGSGRLIGTIIRVVGSTIVNVYRNSTVKTWTRTVGPDGRDVWMQRDTTVESLDRLATIAQATGTEVDTLLSKHRASGKGAKPRSTPPGSKDKRLFARQVIDCAIEARGLSWLADMLLDDERRRTDGSFKWTENADAVWAGFGFPPMTADSDRMRAYYAKRAARLAFAFLPALVAEVYDVIAAPEVMWFIHATSGNQLTRAASMLVSKSRQEHRHPMDGGHSLDMTMRLIDDPLYRARSLACIIAADEDE